MLQKSILIAGIMLAVSGSANAQLKRTNYFFFQITPNIQSPLMISGHQKIGIRQVSAKGGSFDIGYHVGISKNWGIEAGVGGNLYHYAYQLPHDDPDKNILFDRLNSTIDGEYLFAPSIYVAPSYQFRAGCTGTWKAGLGFKLASISASEVWTGNSQSWDPRVTDTYMKINGGLIPAITLFLQKQIIPQWSRLEVGLMANINTTPVAKGLVGVYDGNTHQTSTARFQGNSLGVNIRYSLN